jgi:hypothetical protein
MQSGRKIDDEGESQRILARLAGETEAGSAARGAATKSAGPSPDDDPIEYWGTRIGRGLGLVITVVLIAWLVMYVVRGG